MERSLSVDPRVGQIETEIESLFTTATSRSSAGTKSSPSSASWKPCEKNPQNPCRKLHVSGEIENILLTGTLLIRKSSADFFDPHWMFGRLLAKASMLLLVTRLTSPLNDLRERQSRKSGKTDFRRMLRVEMSTAFL